MIKTQAEYKSALEYINTDLNMYDFELSEKMTSYEYNLYLQDVQYYLNVLYEKIRVLEDLIDYMETYSEEKMDTLIQEIKEKENKLTTNLDKYLSKKSMVYNVQWDIGSLDTIKDRDGNQLKKAVINHNKALALDGYALGEINLNNIIKETDTPSYSDNILTCLEDGTYLTSYSLDAPQKVKELLYIDADNIDKIENLVLEPIGCTIEFIGYSEDNNKAIYKLTGENINKKLENFDYSYYTGSQLENTGKSTDWNYNTAYDINENQKDLNSAINEQIKIELIDDIESKLELKSDQQNKASELETYVGDKNSQYLNEVLNK